MSAEVLVTTLEPRQIHQVMALHNSVIFDSTDRTVQKVIKGVGFGAYSELRADGLRELAEETIFEARRVKEEGGHIVK